MADLQLEARVELERRRRKNQAELNKCAADKVYWFKTYVKTYDPRLLDEGLSPIVPFILYDFQEEYLHWLDERSMRREHGLVEKSRDMGASYLNAGYDLHQWLFVPGYKAGIGSYKEDKVDLRGDMDSIFEKIRHMISALPPWMVPDGFALGGIYDNFMRIVNPTNGSHITGEAGKNIGRGGRSTRYTLDEHAHIDEAVSVEKAVSQNSNCIIYCSTPNGAGNLFYEKRFSGRLPVFTMHWTRHPKKTRAWYEEQKRKLDPITLAQEVDIDYSASVEGLLIPPEWVRAAVDLELEQSGLKAAGLDVGEKRDPSAYVARYGVVVTRIEQWQGLNTTQSAYKAKMLANEDAVDELRYDDIGIGAGITGTLATEADDIGQIDDIELTFDLVGIGWGTPPEEGAFLRDNSEKELRDRFLNQRIVDWWNLRLRFEATYEHVEGIKEHDVEDMISIPNDHELIAELSMPMLKFSGTGKLKLESKDDMRRRGVRSPNKADALAYCFSTREGACLVWIG